MNYKKEKHIQLIKERKMEVNIKACRSNTGMKQSEFAKAIGVTLGTVSNWEKGKTEPTVTQLRKIAEISGIPYEYIITGKNSF